MLRGRKGEFMELVKAFGHSATDRDQVIPVNEFKTCMDALGIKMTQ